MNTTRRELFGKMLTVAGVTSLFPVAVMEAGESKPLTEEPRWPPYVFGMEKTAAWPTEHLSALAMQLGCCPIKVDVISKEDEFSMTEIILSPRPLDLNNYCAVKLYNGAYSTFSTIVLDYSCIQKIVEECHKLGLFLQRIDLTQENVEWAVLKIKFASMHISSKNPLSL